METLGEWIKQSEDATFLKRCEAYARWLPELRESPWRLDEAAKELRKLRIFGEGMDDRMIAESIRTRFFTEYGYRL